MVHVSSNVRENDIFVICIKRHNLSLVFLGKMPYYLHPVTYNNNKNGRKNNISQQHGYKLGYCIPRLNCFFLRLDIFVPIIS